MLLELDNYNDQLKIRWKNIEETYSFLRYFSYISLKICGPLFLEVFHLHLWMKYCAH
jgi:hypothetical protein